MSVDIEARLKHELEQLLCESPQIAPTQLLAGSRLVTFAVEDGLPSVTDTAIPDRCDLGTPRLESLHGTPIYRIYHILQKLHLLDAEEQAAGTADILLQTEGGGEVPVQVIPPTLPPTPELVVSMMSGNATLENKPDEHGMHRHLKALRQRLREKLAEHPDLEPLRLRTAKETVEISATGGQLSVQPTPEAGRYYFDVQTTPQARAYRLHRSIQGLERKLCGEPVDIRIVKSTSKNKAEDNLLNGLRQLNCERLAILVRRSKKILFVSGPEKRIIYAGLQVTLTENGLREEPAEAEPVGYRSMEYGAITPGIRQVLNAFYAYLSARPREAGGRP